MTINIKKTEAQELEIVSGHHRLRAMLQVQGHATVQDIATGEQFSVHMVDGRLQVMSEEDLQNLMREGRKWNAGTAQSKAKKSAPFYRQFAKSKF